MKLTILFICYFFAAGTLTEVLGVWRELISSAQPVIIKPEKPGREKSVKRKKRS